MLTLTVVALSVLLLLDVLCLALVSERGVGFWGFASFVGFWGLLTTLAHLTLDLNVGTWLLHNWQFGIAGFVSYLGVGVVWTFFKWWRFARLSRAKIIEWLDHNSIYPGETTDHFYRKAPGPAQYKDGKFSLEASSHKGRIISWLAMWPFSVIGTLVGDLLFRLWETIYEMFSGVYQRISDLVFADVVVDK